MTASATRLRPLSGPQRLPALKPEYLHRQPALGLGPLYPPPRILLRPHAGRLVHRYSERVETSRKVGAAEDILRSI